MDKIVCAVFDETCPYCDEEGYCRMEEEEGCLPFEECDAFYVFDEDDEQSPSSALDVLRLKLFIDFQDEKQYYIGVKGTE